MHTNELWEAESSLSFKWPELQFFCLPSFVQRKERGNRGSPGAFLPKRKCHLFSESCLWYRLCFYWFRLLVLFSVLWAYGEIVLWVCFVGPNWLNEPGTAWLNECSGMQEAVDKISDSQVQVCDWVVQFVPWLPSDVIKPETFLPSHGFTLHFPIITLLSPRLNSFCPVAIAYINISK